jgi:hypothetical protein
VIRTAEPYNTITELRPYIYIFIYVKYFKEKKNLSLRFRWVKKCWGLNIFGSKFVGGRHFQMLSEQSEGALCKS